MRFSTIPLVLLILWTALSAAAQPKREGEPRDFRAELFLAIELGDFEETRKVLDEGGEDEINRGEPSPLGTAVRLDDLRLVALLISRGGDPNQISDQPLEQAIRTDSLKMVQLLFQVGTTLSQEATPELLKSALRGTHARELYEVLLDQGADLTLALRVAVTSRKLEIARFCLERGADVATLGEIDILDLAPAADIPQILDQAVRDDNREAALSYFLRLAAADGDRPLVNLVLGRGATVTLAHLEKAEEQGQDEMTLYLLEKIPGELPELITRAESEGRTDLVTYLKGLRSRRIGSVVGPVVGAAAGLFVLVAVAFFLRKTLLQSPKRLHQAILRNDPEEVEKLLDAGSNANSWYAGEQPLHIAAKRDNLKMARLLLRYGADPTVSTPGEGWTALHIAARRGNVSLTEALLRNGVLVDVYSPEGLTPLYAAAVAGKSDMVQLLIERGADVNMKVNHQTLLFLAVNNKDTAAAALLLESGADPNLDQGRTTLHSAAALGEPELVRLLLGAGANTSAVDPEGRTPQALALFYKREDVAAILSQGETFAPTFGAADPLAGAPGAAPVGVPAVGVPAVGGPVFETMMIPPPAPVGPAPPPAPSFPPAAEPPAPYSAPVPPASTAPSVPPLAIPHPWTPEGEEG